MQLEEDETAQTKQHEPRKKVTPTTQPQLPSPFPFNLQLNTQLLIKVQQPQAFNQKLNKIRTCQAPTTSERSKKTGRSFGKGLEVRREARGTDWRYKGRSFLWILWGRCNGGKEISQRLGKKWSGNF